MVIVGWIIFVIQIISECISIVFSFLEDNGSKRLQCFFQSIEGTIMIYIVWFFIHNYK